MRPLALSLLALALAPAAAQADDTLRYGSPERAGFVGRHLGGIEATIRAGLEPSPDHPRYPGAVVLAARHGVIAEHRAYGYAVKYADSTPTLLPPERWVPMQRDTIFDMASVSKLFTSIAAMQLVERGQLDLDAPVARYIPAFAQAGKEDILVRQLLTHTSGFQAWLPLWSAYPTPEARIAAVYATAPPDEPNTVYRYSDLNLIVLGELIETLSGMPLDAFIAANVTEPLGLRDTGFNPPAEKLDRIAATEYQPSTGRGMVRGSVHDENAWSLDGVAGHAGVFSTAYDLAVLCQALLNGGRYGGERILRADTVRQLLTNYNQQFPGHDHGLGFELNQRQYMDAMATPFSAGHTGYTGTDLVIDPEADAFVILLTNRVHPSRDWGSIQPDRRGVARAVARAIPVRPATGRDAWFSGIADAATHDLTLAHRLRRGANCLTFRLWYDTEPNFDRGRLELSRDGGASWQELGAYTGWSGRQWHRVTVALGDGPGDALLRWRYETDAAQAGRGVYVDDVRVNGRWARGEWRPVGWTLSPD